MKNNKPLINTITYRAVVTYIPFLPGKVIYNFGTESRIGSRSKEHARQLKRNGNGVYNIISEKEDRVIGNKTIGASHDKDYINRLAEELVSRGAKGIQTLNESIIDIPGLSSTECLILPVKIYNSKLFDAAIAAADEWYYNDKSLRVENKYCNAPTINYKQLDEEGRKEAALPIVYQFHGIIENILSKFPLKKQIKKISVQSLSLADRLKWFFPEVNEINVVVVANDQEKNEELYNKLDTDKLYNIIDKDSDSDVEEYYRTLKDMDLIIGNPPYSHGVHASILAEVVENNPNAEIVWLAPDNLVFGNEAPQQEARELLKNKLVSCDRIGKQFGDIKIATPISIYHFSAEETPDHLDWEDLKISLKTSELPHYVSIKEKIEKAPKINRVNKGDKKLDFRTNGKGTHQQCLEQIAKTFPGCIIPADTLFLRKTGILLYKKSGIALAGKLTKGLVDAYALKFNSEKECKEQLNKLNDPRYRYILKVLTTNNRSLLCKPEDLPESFDACGFTDEEIEELKNYADNK